MVVLPLLVVAAVVVVDDVVDGGGGCGRANCVDETEIVFLRHSVMVYLVREL